MRHDSPRSGLFRRWLATTTALAGVLPMLVLTAPAARANPEGGSVVQGAATIAQTNPKTVTVNQTTDKAVINWRSFSIGTGETTRFNQPSSSSTTLNRVTGDQVSKILGNLSANGKVFLVNPNGIVFGAGSKIDVAALVASTADIKTENFMAGTLRFDIPGKAGAEIINQGTITAADGGLVALVSPVLRNSGIIQARLGKVALASANGVTLDLYGDNLILFQAADKITQQMVDTDGKAVNTAIDNSGRIYADGGRVLMTANTAKGVVDNAINTTGLVSARAVEQQGGEIVLKGEDGGIVQVAGSLDASGTEAGQTGGRVQVTGEKIGLFNGTRINASGDAGGGTVVVGGDYLGGTASDKTLAQLGIRRENRAIATAAYTNMAAGAQISANALSSGDGGKVVLWSDNRTIAYGSITAKGGILGGDGGFIEVSGKKHLEIASLTADASASAGKAGTVLYDPGNVYITSNADAVASYDVTNFTSTTPWDGRTNIAASNIEAVLNNGTNVVIRATPEGPDVDSWGDVYVQHSINKTHGGEAMLSLFSADEIHVASGVSIASTSGKLNLYFDADYDRHSYGGIFLDSGSAIRTNGGFVNLNGSDIYRNGVIDTSVTHPDSSGDTRSGEIRKAHDYFTRVDFSFLAPNPPGREDQNSTPPGTGPYGSWPNISLSTNQISSIESIYENQRYSYAMHNNKINIDILSPEDKKWLAQELRQSGIDLGYNTFGELGDKMSEETSAIITQSNIKIEEAIKRMDKADDLTASDIGELALASSVNLASSLIDVATLGGGSSIRTAKSLPTLLSALKKLKIVNHGNTLTNKIRKMIKFADSTQFKVATELLSNGFTITNEIKQVISSDKAVGDMLKEWGVIGAELAIGSVLPDSASERLSVMLATKSTQAFAAISIVSATSPTPETEELLKTVAEMAPWLGPIYANYNKTKEITSHMSPEAISAFNDFMEAQAEMRTSLDAQFEKTLTERLKIVLNAHNGTTQ